ncbi:helix-turn-helix domain-containing protein [Sphingomonas sp. CJ20]
MSAPLRSETDCSETGINRCPQADRARIEHHLGKSGRIETCQDGSALLITKDYPSFEGAIHNGPFLRLALATGSSTRLVQHVDGAKLEGVWRSGSLTISPPNAKGIAQTGSISVIGLAVLPLDASPPADDSGFDLDHVTGLAGHFHDDAILVSIITALHYGALAHGASTAFFDHGKSLILRRLSELRGFKATVRNIHPLSDTRFGRLVQYVEDRLSYDLSVSEMAEIVGLDSSGFSRALQARTGLTPYAWLTQRRMRRAMMQLRAGISVTEIAAALSYANPGKFSSAFKRITGHSPSVWRKNLDL